MDKDKSELTFQIILMASLCVQINNNNHVTKTLPLVAVGDIIFQSLFPKIIIKYYSK